MSNQLEDEFKILFNAFGTEIENKIQQAEKLMEEATELSEKYGIPFRYTSTAQFNWYVPESYRDRFATLDVEIVLDLTKVSSYRLGRGAGWSHSSIC